MVKVGGMLGKLLLRSLTESTPSMLKEIKYSTGDACRFDGEEDDDDDDDDDDDVDKVGGTGHSMTSSEWTMHCAYRWSRL